MFLKTLTLRGFKSFAAATTLRLEPGITCVVGPNGSGKSNVVDALSWVMGEQGAKTLRGANMADVVFAGTSKRPPLGRAQVELTIDNTDGALPIDYGEVTIRRTMFKGGGSEYSINSTPCRLLDIQELLSDTGMGREMHVIIGQGRLDEVLTATAQERRKFIEEASGVLKHRQRKERALRKLDSMAANLTRVEDLSVEIRRRLGPLARQAATARKAGRIQAQIRDAAARLLADSVAELQAACEAANTEQHKLEQTTKELHHQVQHLRTQTSNVEAGIKTHTPQLEQATATYQELGEICERLRSDKTLITERLRVARTPLAKIPGKNPTQLQEAAQTATEKDQELLTEVQTAQKTLKKTIENRQKSEEEEQQAGINLATAQRKQADLREKHARAQGRVDGALSRAEAAANELDRARIALQEAQKRTAQATQIYEALEQITPDENNQEKYQKTCEQRDKARNTVDELLLAEKHAQSELATWRSRRDTLALSLTPDDQTQKLLGKDKVQGLLSQLLTVDTQWEQAITALLGPLANAVVTAGLDQATALAVKQDGPVQLVITDENNEKTAPHFAALPPECNWASTAIKVKTQNLQHTVEQLLYGAALCPDLETAKQALKSGANLAATIDGTLLTQHSLQSIGQKRTGVLALTGAHEEACTQTKLCQEKLTQTQNKLHDAKNILDTQIKNSNEALKEMRAADAKQAAKIEKYARIQTQLKAAKLEEERLQETLTKLARELEERQLSATRSQNELTQLEAETPNTEQDLTQLKQEHETTQKNARTARENETSARLALRTLEEQSRTATGRARALRAQANEAKWAHEKAQQAAIKQQKTITKLEKLLTAVTYANEMATRSREMAREQLEQLRACSAATSNELTQLRSQLDKEISLLGQMREKLHVKEVELTQLQLRLEALAQRAMEEFGLELGILIDDYGPGQPVPDFANFRGDFSADNWEQMIPKIPYEREHQEQVLVRAQNELKRLGKVNPLALEEHTALSERYEYLISQLGDLKKSRSDLLAIIADVDQRVERVFEAAFADTATAFESVFAKLFPGGTGRLVLTDPSDMLSTGIDIEARPPGKKVKRLSLLSGGERSLAAIAFLFAIFVARPSPFYVLDEVEAALDDTNLSRLLRIFKELQVNSQLIIVTHQKRTMEIADALYGVTMQDGVTQVVSQRLAGLAGTCRED